MQKTLFIAIALVVGVVILFLQTWRAAIIPVVAIPMSLVGCFLVMGLVGISFNTLSLFGLVLAIGIVVDDAIVVVENVERYIEKGMPPREAAHVTMDEVGGALIAIALVLCAVFIPTAFISGLQGSFYRQFAITIAAATVISAFVSLTLSPALAALLLKPREEAPRRTLVYRLGAPVRGFFAGFNWVFERLSLGYGNVVSRLVRVGVIVLVVYAGLIYAAYDRLAVTPTGLIPQLDRGYLIAAFQLPPGASLARTDAVIRHASEIILARPGVQNSVAFTGFDGATFTNAPNAGVIFVPLKPFEERVPLGLTAAKIPADLRQQLVAARRCVRVRAGAALGAGHRHRRRAEAVCAGPRRTWAAGAGAGDLDRRWFGGANARLHPGVHAVQHAHAADLRRHRPHQGGAAAGADRPRVQYAVGVYGFGVHQRLQPARPHLPVECAGRQSVPAERARCREPEDAQQLRRHGADRFGGDIPRHHRTVPGAAIQSVSGGRGAVVAGARLLHRPGDRGDREDRATSACRRVSASNGPRSRCRRSSPATPR